MPGQRKLFGLCSPALTVALSVLCAVSCAVVCMMQFKCVNIGKVGIQNTSIWCTCVLMHSPGLLILCPDHLVAVVVSQVVYGVVVIWEKLSWK